MAALCTVWQVLRWMSRAQSRTRGVHWASIIMVSMFNPPPPSRSPLLEEPCNPTAISNIFFHWFPPPFALGGVWRGSISPFPSSPGPAGGILVSPSAEGNIADYGGLEFQSLIDTFKFFFRATVRTKTRNRRIFTAFRMSGVQCGVVIGWCVVGHPSNRSVGEDGEEA